TGRKHEAPVIPRATTHPPREHARRAGPKGAAMAFSQPKFFVAFIFTCACGVAPDEPAAGETPGEATSALGVSGISKVVARPNRDPKQGNIVMGTTFSHYLGYPQATFEVGEDSGATGTLYNSAGKALLTLPNFVPKSALLASGSYTVADVTA